MMKKTKFILLLLTFTLLTSHKGKAQDGKIVFSKTPTTGSFSPASTFDVGEKIYFSVELVKAASEFPTFNDYNERKSGDNGSGFCIYAYIDDFKGWDKCFYVKGQAESHMLNSMTAYKYPEQSEQLKNGKKFDLLLNDKATSYFGIDVGFNDALNKLANGPHQVRLVFWGYSGGGAKTKKPLAYGDFTLNKSETTKTKLGRSYDDFEAKMSDPELEAKALKYFQNDFDFGDSKKNKFLKTKILSSDWYINRYTYSGAITGRELEFAVLVKKPDGSCEVQKWNLEQGYTGQGYQDTFHLGPTIPNSNKQLVDCD